MTGSPGLPAPRGSKVPSSESPSGSLSDEQGPVTGVAGLLDGGNALDPTTGGFVGPLPNGPDYPLQARTPGGRFQNEVNGSVDSNDHDGHVPDFKDTTANDPQTQDHGPFNIRSLNPATENPRRAGGTTTEGLQVFAMHS